MSVHNIMESGDRGTSPELVPPRTGEAAEGGAYLLLRQVAEAGVADGAALVARSIRDGLSSPGSTPPCSARLGLRSGRPIRRPLGGSDILEVRDVVISSRMLSLVWRQAGRPTADQ